jgi:hypothetical protein
MHRHADDFCLHLWNNLLEDRHADDAGPQASFCSSARLLLENICSFQGIGLKCRIVKWNEIGFVPTRPDAHYPRRIWGRDMMKRKPRRET